MSTEPTPEGPKADEKDPTEPKRDQPARPGAKGSPEQQVIQNFYGPSNGAYGIAQSANATASRRLTGPISAALLADTLVHYTETAGHDAAKGVLLRRGLLVLRGRAKTGKRMAGLALIAAVATNKKVALSPGYTLEELAEYPFKKGYGYLICDRLADDGPAAEARFASEILADRLKNRGAFLVITINEQSGGVFSDQDLVLQWDPIDTVDLVNGLLLKRSQRLLDNVEEEAVRESLALSPGEACQFGEEVADGNGAADRIERARHALNDLDADTVRGWFDSPGPSRQSLIAITTAAFADQQPQVIYERLRLQLEQIMAAESGFKTSNSRKARGKQIAQWQNERVSQDRFKLTGEVEDDQGLLVISDTVSARARRGLSTERLVTFKADSYRPVVIEQLWKRYSATAFWRPVALWLDEIARTESANARLEISKGIAYLRRESSLEVHDSFIRPWSKGNFNQQSTAVFVLWWMSSNDQLAPDALSTALDWAASQDEELVHLGALALGGGLAHAYPGQCTKELWSLAREGTLLTRFIARMALSELIDSSSEDSFLPRLVLRDLADQIDGVFAESASSQTRRRVFAAALGILSHGSSKTPTIASFLESCPDQAELLGGIWGDVLLSRPHRVGALRALARAARPLVRQEPGKSIFRRLSAALRAQMPANEWELLEKDTRRVIGILTESDEIKPSMRDLLSAIQSVK